MPPLPGPLVGRGRTAEILAWETGWVLKLFDEWVSEAAAQREYQLARQAHEQGAATPAVKEFVRVDHRFGFVLEHVSGPTLLTLLTTQPWRLLEAAHLLASLQAQLHACAAPGWPAQRQRLQAAIGRASAHDPDAGAVVLRALAALPDGAQLCHGDFHPDNVILTGQRPVIIDWIDSTRGHPLADVARTSLLARLGEPPPDHPGRWFIRLGRGLFHAAYLRRYFHLRPDLARAQLAGWELPIAVARIAEGIEAELPHLRAIWQSARPKVKLDTTALN